MKKILAGLILVSFLAFPVFALAQQAGQWGEPPVPETCTITHDLSDINSACTDGADVPVDTLGLCCVFNAIHTVADWVFWTMMVIIILLVVVGGFIIMTAAGDPEKVSKGRNYIVFALIGLAIALLARAIPTAVRIIMGMPTT